jgi:fibronectin type 3 domain-containing protein
LSWTLSDNATWLQLTTSSGTTTTETDTINANVTTSGLAAGTYNAIITVTASGATNTPRQIPVSLTLSASVAGTATLAWNASTESDLEGYKVYRGTGSGAYGAPLSTLPKTATSYTATGLQNGTTYFFVITAYDNAGNESTFSNEVSKSIF